MSASKKSSIKCQPVEYIRGYDSTCTWIIRFSRDHGIVVVNCNSDCLYIYDKDVKKLGTLKFPGLCGFHDLVSHQGLVYLVCGLKDGKIFSCSLQQWYHQKKKKKSKSKSKNNDEKRQHGGIDNDPPRMKEKKQEIEFQDGQEDIFGDLLAGGDGSSSVTKDGCHHSSESQFKEFWEIVGEITMVDNQKLMLETQNLEGFVLVNDSLVTCCREGVGWRISIHSCQTNKESGDFIACDKNPLYSSMVFGADVDSNFSRSSNQASSSSPGIGCYDDGMDGITRVGVYGLVSSSSHGNLRTLMQSCSICVTSDMLFDAVWGSEANLVDSPVILITLPDGCVYSILLKSFHPTFSSSPSAKAFRLLCRSLGPVTDICTVSYTKESDPVGSISDCLLLVGAGGQLMAFHTNPKDTTSNEISRLHISANISVVTSTKDTLICASNFDLIFITFYMKNSNLQMIKRSCGMPGLATMTLLKGTGSSYKLLAVKKNGTVLQLLVSLEDTTGTDHLDISSTAARQRVHEALRNMREVSSKMGALTRQGNRQRALLEELSRAHHIVCQTGDSFSAFQLESTVDCILENGQRRTKVSCRVTNYTNWTMSSGWTLIGSLSGRCYEGSLVSASACHRTRSVPLVKFAPKKSVILSFVLDECKTPMSCPLIVDCYLCFDLTAHLADTLKQEDHNHVRESSVTLDRESNGAVFMIGSSSVDALDSLQSRRHFSAGIEGRNQGFNWTKAAFAGLSWTNQRTSFTAHRPVASMTIQVDRSLLCSFSNAADGGSTREQLLRELLPSNQSVDIRNMCIEALTPCGSLVSIQAQECGTKVISLQVTSSDEGITRELIEAIHTRLKESKLMTAEFKVDRERMNKESSIAMRHLGKLHEINDQLTTNKSRGDLNILAKELMDLHGNIRSNIVLH